MFTRQSAGYLLDGTPMDICGILQQLHERIDLCRFPILTTGTCPIAQYNQNKISGDEGLYIDK